MASITKTPEGTYRAQIRKKGYRTISKNFTRKTSAERWARQVEVEMEKGIFVSTTEAESTTVGELLKRYEEEIAPSKKSYADLKYRIKLLDQQFGHFTLAALTSSQIKDYRDERLKTRKEETVRKELGVLNRVLEFAIKDCEIHLPKDIPYIVIFALETGMRRGEIARLQWKDVDLKKCTAIARNTKNGEDRTIPLSSKAIGILRQLPRDIIGQVFPIRADSITQAFDRCRQRAGIKNLRLHDLRHEATSRFFEKGLNI
ncbi:site-specific integrase [Zooshikella marina]|uniref:site-specific integrase n=1 Tax=Zooshikella ganghwensis TaxID=202772 RepID=UPI001BB0CF94|nr:site-specific integrase [Zooshikella ganghwensis]MBU2708638.1 site-specific integrase [Zooshikella ganghwensis]